MFLLGTKVGTTFALDNTLSVVLERLPRQDDTLDRLGEKLKALRASRGWRQGQVATAVGYSNHSTYNKLENGTAPQPSARVVLRLARLYGVTTDVLLRDELDLPPAALNKPVRI